MPLQFKHLPAKLHRSARKKGMPSSAAVQRRAQSWADKWCRLRLQDVRLQWLFQQLFTQHTDHSFQKPDSTSLRESRIFEVGVRRVHVEDICYLLPHGVDLGMLPLILKTPTLAGIYILKKKKLMIAYQFVDRCDCCCCCNLNSDGRFVELFVLTILLENEWH